jgi:RNA polymerase sigma factor (sigma-70 family)
VPISELQDESTVEVHLRQSQSAAAQGQARPSAQPSTQRPSRQAQTDQLLRQARLLDSAAWLEAKGSRTARRLLRGKRSGRRLDRQGLCELACQAAAIAGEGELVGLAPHQLRQAQAIRWRVALLHDALARSCGRDMARQRQDEAEAIQLAREGLYQAALRYDPDRGVSFATYAHWWMRAVCTRELSGLQLSRRVQERLRNLRKLERMFGGDLSDLELADWLGISLEQLWDVRQLAHTQEQASLDASQLEDGTTLHDLLAAPTPEEEQAADHQRVLELMGYLTPFQARVLVVRYGLVPGTEPTSLPEAGAALGYSRERIRQVERDALWALRVLLTDRAHDVGVDARPPRPTSPTPRTRMEAR